MSDSNETLLIPKRSLKGMLEKMKGKGDDWLICPRCDRIFKPGYEACYCKKYGEDFDF